MAANGRVWIPPLDVRRGRSPGDVGRWGTPNASAPLAPTGVAWGKWGEEWHRPLLFRSSWETSKNAGVLIDQKNMSKIVSGLSDENKVVRDSANDKKAERPDIADLLSTLRSANDVARTLTGMSFQEAKLKEIGGENYVFLHSYPDLKGERLKSIFGIDHPKVVSLGIGAKGVKKALRHNIYFTLLVDSLDLVSQQLAKDEWSWKQFVHDFGGQLPKSAAVAVATTLAQGFFLAAGTVPLLAVAAAIGAGYLIGAIVSSIFDRDSRLDQLAQEANDRGPGLFEEAGK